MKILITGACGFVGSTLARSWIQSDPNVAVCGLDNFIRPGSEANRGALRQLGVQLFHGDIRMASDFESLPAVDWVIDAAASPSVLAGVDGQTSSRQLVEHNLQGTVNILEYCRRCRAGLILLSTSRVYSVAPLAALPVEPVGMAFDVIPHQTLPPGVSAAGIHESFSTLPPLSLYGSTKLAAEILALEYGEAFDFPVWINRCGVLAGPGQFGRADQGIFAYWINAWLRRRPLRYIGFGGHGYQVRDALHPRDLVPLLKKQTARSQASVRCVNIGGGRSHAISLAQLSDWCRNRFGSHQVSGEPRDRRYDVPWLIMDCGLARAEWDWQAETPLAQILEEIALHAESHPHWLELSGAP